MSSFLNHRFFSYYDLSFAVVGRNLYFARLKQDIVEFLKASGFPADQYESLDDVLCSEKNYNSIIVVNPLNFQLPKDRHRIWVAIQTEQIYSKIIGGGEYTKNNKNWLRRYLKNYDIVMDFSEVVAAEISKGFHGRVGVMKYSISSLPSQEFFYSEKNKKYDILFIGEIENVVGSLYSRRKLILDRLSRKYVLHPNADHLWGTEKEKAIEESRVCLNLHSEETRYYEIERLRDYASKGAFILSDRMFEDSPFQDGEDFISFFLGNLESKIDFYLEHAEEREKIAKNAFLKNYAMSLDNSLGKMLDNILLESRERQQKEERKGNFCITRRIYRQKIHCYIRQKLSDKHYRTFMDMYCKMINRSK